MSINIKSLQVNNDGHVFCTSEFYSTHDVITSSNIYTFRPKINLLEGEIDSGAWAVSYLLSMYTHRSKKIILFGEPVATVNGELMNLKELTKFSCYLDKEYPLFSKRDTVYNQISRGLKKSKFPLTADEIKDLFKITDTRIHRPLTGMGNEIFKAMAAICYANGKQIYCFPWLSKMRFESYHKHLTELLKTLENLERIIILPKGIT